MEFKQHVPLSEEEFRREQDKTFKLGLGAVAVSFMIYTGVNVTGTEIYKTPEEPMAQQSATTTKTIEQPHGEGIRNPVVNEHIHQRQAE